MLSTAGEPTAERLPGRIPAQGRPDSLGKNERHQISLRECRALLPNVLTISEAELERLREEVYSLADILLARFDAQVKDGKAWKQSSHTNLTPQISPPPHLIQ